MGRFDSDFILRGLGTALVTPFRDGEVDYRAFGALVDRQVLAGVDFLVPLGSTGETPCLEDDENAVQGCGCGAAEGISAQSPPSLCPVLLRRRKRYRQAGRCAWTQQHQHHTGLYYVFGLGTSSMYGRAGADVVLLKRKAT